MAMRRSAGRATRFLASAALLGCVALTGAGCVTTGTSGITGSIAANAAPRTEADWRREAAAQGARYRANPADPDVAIAYARALTALGERAQAVSVLEQASMHHPNDKAVLGAYGRALADNGNFQQAFDVLGRAHTPEDPDWHILSAQGAVLDQLGRNEEAQQYYASALKIVPDEPSVLSNLGLSYLLQNNLPKAEETLRRAHEKSPSDPRLRANLAVVLGLEGHQAEAENIVKADLPPEEAANKVAALRQLLTKKQQRAEK